jgi:lysophospholipase L1-like esterase
VLVASGLVAPTAGAATRDRLRRAGPRRVLLVGDSITISYQSLAAARLQAKGYVVIKAGVGLTGLLDEGRCRGEYANALAAAHDPDIIVYEHVTNYQSWPACKNTGPYLSKKYWKRLKGAARLTQKPFLKRKARFLWMLMPQTNLSSGPSVIPTLNNMYRQVGGKKTGFVDAWTAFGGPTYHASLHIADGLHLNATGQQKLADVVVAAVG